jgi:dihydrofolate reductase
MRVSLIAAMAENRVIGVNNSLPWHLPDDLKRFRRLTTGHTVIMGRKNYESIGKPLPQRRNVVVTRRTDFQAPGCIVVHSLEEALATAGDDPEVFVIGGAEIYREMLARADRLYLTLVHARIAGDTYFPEFDLREWRETARERHEPNDQHRYACSYITYEHDAKST